MLELVLSLMASTITIFILFAIDPNVSLQIVITVYIVMVVGLMCFLNMKKEL